MTILLLVITSIAGVLILDLFAIENKVLGILSVMVLSANPIICATLAYSYTAVNYSLAFLFSVFSVFCIYRWHKVMGVLAGGVCIAISMSSYQAYISVTCLLILMLLIKMLLLNADKKNILGFLVKSTVSIIAGGIIYFILTQLLLARFNTKLSSYKGVSGVSLKNIILNFPQNIRQCYRNCTYFFSSHHMFLNLHEMFRVVLICLICMTVFCIIYQFLIILRKNWRYAALFLLCIALIPIAASAITLIVPGSNSRLMSMSMIVCIILLSVLVPVKGKLSFFAKRGYCLFLLAFLWVNILSVTNEQLALKEGKTASAGLAEAVLGELVTGGYLEEDYTVALIGGGPANPLFARREAWSKVWGEDRFGDSWQNNNEFWRYLFREYCGIQLHFCTNGQYNELCEKEEVMNMSEFPQKGSIIEVDGITVVKISNTY
ncbi:glucosyltransferase domain-containing protein [Acetatifactor muris]|uniref:glucosyltransferase domain-containing protein n=1 Tax=Acetatifactor muris TaxID=879566 RepID=UPI0023F4166F|nr:glucosyltransferase domain-containing protein [Acetatifactor muris]